MLLTKYKVAVIPQHLDRGLFISAIYQMIVINTEYANKNVQYVQPLKRLTFTPTAVLLRFPSTVEEMCGLLDTFTNGNPLKQVNRLLH